jgi:transcription elongation GreA/GreB family factor
MKEEEPILPESEAIETVVAVGSKVTVEEEGYTCKDTFQIVSEEEKKEAERFTNLYYVSANTPFAKSLINHKCDETVDIVPEEKGQVPYRLKIVHINNEDVKDPV